MHRLYRLLWAACLLIGYAGVAQAASLQVSPVSLEIIAPSNASALTLHNLAATPTDVQLRVFKWTQKDGEEQLTPTTDVVASPPAANLASEQDYTVRVVRVSDKPVEGEETYRLFVDELPQTSRKSQSSVKFLFRYSIPVFFSQPGADSQLSWTASSTKDKIELIVRNEGAQHVRISSLKIQNQSGATIAVRDGLVGYVLPHSTAQWSAHTNGKITPLGAVIRITAQGNNGQIIATAAVQAVN
jgi:fimbrial chaperone protein